MITFNENWSFRRDRYQWILTENYDGFEKNTDIPKRQSRETYHTTIEQMLRAIIDKECGDCTSLSEIRTLLKNPLLILRVDESAFTQAVERCMS